MMLYSILLLLFCLVILYFIGKENFHFKPLNLPKDSKDSKFIQNFSVKQKQEILEFFETYGFVVIKNVLSESEIKSTIDEIWEILQFKEPSTKKQLENLKLFCELNDKKFEVVNRENPNTWTFEYGWPFQGAQGLLGGSSSFHYQAFLNRLNPNVYESFSNILGTKDLWTSIDRYGIMRPTKNVKINGEIKDMEKWKTTQKWLHWDLNPWEIKNKTPPTFNTKQFNFLSENNDNYQEEFKVQGLISLLDSTENDGGFLCVPGFHKKVIEWASANVKQKSPKTSNFVMVPKEDEIQKYVQKITVKAGSLIIWNSRLPHCNYPNNSNNFRLNQYLKMFQSYKDAPKDYLEMRRNLLKQNLPKQLVLNEVDKKLLGIEDF